MRNLIAGLFLVALLAAGAAGAFTYATVKAEARADAETRRFSRALLDTLDGALARLDARVDQLGARFEGIDNLKTAQELQLRRLRNADHLEAARRFGIGRVSGEAMIDRLAAEGRLVRITRTPYYEVQELTHSANAVTQDAARLLELIGERFHAALRARGLPLYRYCITSVLRTEENQLALRGINPNATRGVSSHEFGTTLDIVYHRYDYVAEPGDALPPTAYPFLNERVEAFRARAYDALGMLYWQELQGILGRVLIELQAEGRVLVTLEREQPVFHITVSESLGRE